MKRILATRVIVNEGTTSFGNSTTLLATKLNRVTLELTQHGVFVTHPGVSIKVLVPYSNCKSIDFDYHGPVTAEHFSALEEKPSEPVAHPAVQTKLKK